MQSEKMKMQELKGDVDGASGRMGMLCWHLDDCLPNDAELSTRTFRSWKAGGR